MPKINQEEYEVLKEAQEEGYKWIAKDRYKIKLWVHKDKPYKLAGFGGWISSTLTSLDVNDNLFQFIQWEDEEPYNIAELIEGYEDSKEYKDSLVIEYFMDKAKESEETEVKDIEWAKKEIKKIRALTFDAYEAAVIANNKHFQVKNSEQLALINKIMEILDQLDEPEVLSQEWIDENSTNLLMSSPMIKWVEASKLQNLLVPKQEEITEEQAWEVIHGKYGDEVLQNNIDYVESQGYVVIEKPTIPQFVAEHYESLNEWGQEEFKNIKWMLELAFTGDDGFEKEPGILMWIADNPSVYVLMVKAVEEYIGYEVEEDKKYVIDTDDVEISDGNHYLTHLSLSKDDTELPIVGYKDDAIRFDNKEQAEAIASYVGGRVEELEE